jgi:hypothetical protein
MQLEDIDFLIIGATKSATTWLRYQLQSDPDIYMPSPELHFFSREFHRGTSWYLDQFTPHPGARLIGEKSNSYLDTEEAAERMRATLPDARLIVMLRDPVERAYSDYCMCYRRGEVARNIEDYLDPRRAAELRFLKGSRYDLHLRRVLSHFDQDALLVTQYEQLSSDPQKVLDGVRHHLGLPQRPVAGPPEQKINDRNSKLLPLSVRRRFAPLKPLVRPLRGTKPFEAVRDLFTAKVRYPGLSDDLRRRMSDYFAPMEGELATMGYPMVRRVPTTARQNKIRDAFQDA